MKALTLTQPWATLVAIGAKRIETRSWRTSYRGPLAIHAAKGFPKEAQAFARRPPVSVLLGMHFDYPRGSVIATCRLVDCFQVEVLTQARGGVLFSEDEPERRLTWQEQSFGNYSKGRFAWILDNVQALPEPVPAKGALGLWELNIPIPTRSS